MVTPLDPVYYNFFFNNQTLVVPYNQEHTCQFSEKFKFLDQDITERVKKFRNKNIYYLSTVDKEEEITPNQSLEEFLKENACEFRSVVEHKKFVIKKLSCQ